MNMSKSRDIQAKMPSPVSSVFIITEPFFPHYYIIHLCKKIVTDDSGHQMLVYYSLGNFISTQKDPVCLLGGMADITIVRDPVSDALSIRNADLVPLVTHYNHDQNIYTVYKLSDYTEELAASHGVHAESTEPFTLETLQEQYKKVLTQDYHTLG